MISKRSTPTIPSPWTSTWECRLTRSLVEVIFVPLADDRTRVTLTLSNWEGFGDMAEMLRMHYGSGWDIIFAQSYQSACGG